MSQLYARLALGGYRWAGALLYPFLGSYLAYRTARGKEDRARRAERYGRASERRPDGPVVWFHAASVGETNAVVGLIESVADRGVSIVLTTGTVTSAGIAAKRLAGRVVHQYVPLDFKPAVSRFLEHWKPDLAVIAESEIWPTTILELGRRRIPQVLVNGRLSDRSFRSWHKRPHLAAALFEGLSHVAAQSETDAERFRALGAHSVSVSGNLKADVEAPGCNRQDLMRLRQLIGGRRVWAAISTFEGEESAAATVHLTLKEEQPDLLTVVVPRHPERGDAIERMMRLQGLNVARRSLGDPITAETDILLGDTIGEMGLYLRLTDIAFVGRSLTAEGGQNPLEPAMLGCAVLSGRNVGNFRETYRNLVDAGAAKIVKDAPMLARGVGYLMSNEAARKAMCEAAAATVQSMRGALPLTVAALDPYITPLTVEARLRPSDPVVRTAGG